MRKVNIGVGEEVQWLDFSLAIVSESEISRACFKKHYSKKGMKLFGMLIR
jgi:hypothetical protein